MEDLLEMRHVHMLSDMKTTILDEGLAESSRPLSLYHANSRCNFHYGSENNMLSWPACLLYLKQNVTWSFAWANEDIGPWTHRQHIMETKYALLGRKDWKDSIGKLAGESTTMALIAERWGLIPDLKTFAADGHPIWGTCAGLIFLADRATGQLNSKTAAM